MVAGTWTLRRAERLKYMPFKCGVKVDAVVDGAQRNRVYSRRTENPKQAFFHVSEILEYKCQLRKIR